MDGGDGGTPANDGGRRVAGIGRGGGGAGEGKGRTRGVGREGGGRNAEPLFVRAARIFIYIKTPMPTINLAGPLYMVCVTERLYFSLS